MEQVAQRLAGRLQVEQLRQVEQAGRQVDRLVVDLVVDHLVMDHLVVDQVDQVVDQVVDIKNKIT